MPKNSEPHPLSSAKCKRLVRPLLSKIHSLTDLYSKYPAKFVFDCELFISGSSEDAHFTKPATAEQRLVSLKPFLSLETYDAYVEIFNIFKNIVSTLYPDNAKTTKNGVPRLSFLAAHKLGKSIALGTKSTHYSLNQTALFDPASIPLYLRKYHDQLAEDIDEWLLMEPGSVLGQHRSQLLLGYVMHILVFNLRVLFYTLIPVLCHWLHEQKMQCLRTLFVEFWLFLYLDPDHEEVQDLTVPDKSRDPSLATFWLFHKIGYWQQMVRLLHIKSLVYSSAEAYSALLLEALICSDRLDLAHVDVHEVYALMRTNLQHPKNTQILVATIAQLITSFQKNYDVVSTSSEAHAAIFSAYLEIRNFLQAWVCLSKTLIFNTLDKGNTEIFDACSKFADHLKEICTLIIAYLESRSRGGSRSIERVRKFKKLLSEIGDLSGTCEVLRAFFLDIRLQSSEINASPTLVQYLASFTAEEYDRETLEVFMGWFEEQDQTKYGDFISLLQSHISAFEH
ncbi:hypothetical protein METBIDRAFT_43469 [Metschnikowia bicuspidata var. bicuspidata NRRL YB-4993]|uniref:Uncharacterized protein n=1 Tax=Metschnikowia bicuspidata var. bicuspidata NRRL YB-4993 TaxID=869754 RepID=A0A1A0H8A1_9ASCO|nr:hypothetical protein METBIDRAFT_43469 [Metschnikowia bicuspidata var. bicuspidata NRRL YB-4993]OBA20251.1 hypothetical protein METBIDRAFT_43469 [Metschnikowia bicuspidata var. bicuspidata NRRL YB-4993]